MTPLELQIGMILTVEGYCSTWRLGLLLRQKEFMVKTSALLRVCKKLENSGVLKKHIYSTSNNYVWQIKT
jgi:hypothetical protein